SGPEGGILVNWTDQRWIGFYDLGEAGAGQAFGDADLACGPTFRLCAAWARTGTSPAVVVRRFDGDWGAEEVANGSSTQDPESPTVAVDDADVPHLLWVEALSGTKRVFYNRRVAAGWGAPAPVSPATGDAAEPDVAVDASGNLHLVYTLVAGSDRLVFYATRTASTGAWSVPVVVSQNSDLCSGPCIALDGGGGVHVAYSLFDLTQRQIYLVSNTTGTWGTPALRSGSTYLDAVEPDLEASGSGAGLVLDLVWRADGDTASSVVWHSEYATGAWGAPEKASPDDDAGDFWCRPDVVRDADGVLRVGCFIDWGTGVGFEIFEKTGSLWVLRYNEWQNATTRGFFEFLRDGGGHLHALYCHDTGRIAYRHRK
ncbi:MAG: hypothetical protein MUC63_08155, partial [Planctomycetes bacterium]|nr:hypothetical protein [Planctomycetota bacterium]